MEIHQSARRHGIDDSTIQHVVDHAIVVVDVDEHDDPPKLLVIGPDGAGNLLEVIVLELADYRRLAAGGWRSTPCRCGPPSMKFSQERTMPDPTTPYRTTTGKVLTDSDIEAFADEAEQGYDVEALKTRRRGRPMIGDAPAEVVPVRLDPALKDAVEARAAADETTTSDIIREALRRFLGVA